MDDCRRSSAKRRGPDGAHAGIDGVVEYASDLFDQATVETIIERWVRLLTAAVADPDCPLSGIDLLSGAERDRLLVEYNDTAVPVAEMSLPGMVEAQVRATPEAVAVVGEQSTLSYRQLNTAANRLAHALIAQGAGPEQLVAVALPRSVELVIAILAVLKAGAGYLPVDPDFPPARIASLLTEAHPVLVLDDPHTITDPGSYPQTNPTNRDRRTVLRPEHPAYVIYTSGSTGRPKGVLMTQRAVVNHMLWMQHALPLTEHDTVLQRTSVTFDASVWELFAPLITGARLQLTPPSSPVTPRNHR